MNRVRYMLSMICMLLAYGFDFRTQAVFTCTAGSAITIHVKKYAPARKTSLRGEYNWDWSGISSCGDFKGLTQFTRSPLFSKTRQMEAFLARWFYANMWHKWTSKLLHPPPRLHVFVHFEAYAMQLIAGDVVSNCPMRLCWRSSFDPFSYTVSKQVMKEALVSPITDLVSRPLSIGVRAGGARGAAAPPNFGQLRFFGQHEKIWAKTSPCFFNILKK